MIFLVWVLNFVISWANAWGCGKTWNETKHVGGFPHFMNWMGAIMSASGFTWCYLVIAGLAGTVIPVEHANHVRGPMLSPAALDAFSSLGYLVVLLPIIGSGLAITVHSWGVFWRRRTLAHGAAAGWNSFAQVYNMAGALRHAPDAWKGVSSFFGSKSESKDSKGYVLALVVLSAFAGILTTAWIIRATARSTAASRGFEAMLREA